MPQGLDNCCGIVFQFTLNLYFNRAINTKYKLKAAGKMKS